ncbi:hypothetical protein AAP_01333 [Ascosphaera apis ARSEF 7405]|uniref:Uncharacterized protein n=1 Tax=Ascosphaera apis ARSEF 7405 TaxID=392613 RepID=A0A168BRU6_9EURO|nr:hypothetical protein AAP_01333 [Ascosphaera apis ARSEF 7405]
MAAVAGPDTPMSGVNVDNGSHADASPERHDSGIDLSEYEAIPGDDHAALPSDETRTPASPSAERENVIVITETPRDRINKPGPFKRIRARATSIGRRVYSVGQSQPPPSISDTTASQEIKKKESPTFINFLWSKIQKVRTRKLKTSKKHGEPSGPINLVDNETATPLEAVQNHESDDESDGNFSAIEIFDQEYSEEGSEQKGFRMVRYIPRRERGADEDISVNTGTELIYVPYSPDSERNDRLNKRSKKST